MFSRFLGHLILRNPYNQLPFTGSSDAMTGAEGFGILHIDGWFQETLQKILSVSYEKTVDIPSHSETQQWHPL